MNLKIMIKNMVAFIVFAAVIVGLNACGKVEKTKEIGLQLWSVRHDMNDDPQGTIEKIGAMGYKLIEAANYNDGKFYGMEPEEFKALVDKNGLNFFASHVVKALPDSGDMDSVMAWWDTCIAAHKAAGVKYIIQPIMVGGDAYGSLKGVQRNCDYFNAVGEKCNANGIRFGFHNHDYEFKELEGQVIFDYMLEHTDPAKVMFELDLYYLVTSCGENSLSYLDKYPGRFELWHVKDHKELGGADSEIDFAPIFAQAEKAGMEYYIVEVEDYSFEPLVSVQKSLEFLQNADFTR